MLTIRNLADCWERCRSHPGAVRLLEDVREVGAALLDLFFPIRCAGCGDAGMYAGESRWCQTCRESLAWVGSPLCPCCGTPFLDSPASPDHLCGDCLNGAFHFDSARSAVLYGGVVRERIHQLKFGGKLHWTPPLAELLERAWRSDATQQSVDVIVPIPLHIRRLRQRGFNQSALLARELGRRVELPVRFDVLDRTRWTDPQTRLKRNARLENVKGAFEALRPARLEGRSVLLVDDVFTTGTTISECARVLKKAGAAEVHALTAARVMADFHMRKGLEF
jgi:ComF family protein